MTPSDEGASSVDVVGQMLDKAPFGLHRAPRRRRRRVIALCVPLGLVVLLALGGWIAVRTLLAGYDRNIERFADPFAGLPQADRPAPGATGAVNLLLLGSDSRISAGDARQWSVGAQRTDAIMLVHLNGDHRGGAVVSIPRDSWVPIPGHGNAKINAAFSYGGPTLLVRTVENLTGVRVDHVVVADFTGFRQITNALGGVDIDVPQTTSDTRARFPAGAHHMDGATALDYVRQRYDLPGGDFDRVRRQQNWIRAVLTKLTSGGTLRSPLTLNAALAALTRSVALDEGFTMGRITDLGRSTTGLRPGALRFLVAPVTGTGTSADGQSVVRLDAHADRALWDAVRADRVDAWVQTTHAPDLGPVVR